MSPVAMETVVVVAIGILGTIFVSALVALLVVCRHKYCRPLDLISRQHLQENNPDAQLVDSMEGQSELPSGGGLELDDVTLTPNLDHILHNEAWVNDATGLIPHCLAILKTAHLLTEKLVGMTMGNAGQLTSAETITDLVSIAKRISPRVDDVVRAMYPPLDPRLLEARCTALVLSVSHLVLVTKNACRLSGVLDWIDQSLADVEDHLQVLREASANYEEMRTSHSNTMHPAQQTSNLSANEDTGQGSPVIRVQQPANQNLAQGSQGVRGHMHLTNQIAASTAASGVQPDIVHDNVQKVESSSEV